MPDESEKRCELDEDNFDQSSVENVPDDNEDENWHFQEDFISQNREENELDRFQSEVEET